MFLKETGDWKRFRALEEGMPEVDFHPDSWGEDAGEFTDFHSKMSMVFDRALEGLQQAQLAGNKYVLFTHGRSTSRSGRTSARSVVRQLMRSKEATPYLIRKDCIQHESVFVACIREVK
jgi:hypothetical protein